MVSGHLLGPALVSLGRGTLLAGGPAAFVCNLVVQGFLGWAFGAVIEVAVVLTLRWLLAVGPPSLIFLVFIAFLSRLFGGGPMWDGGLEASTYAVSRVCLVALHPGCQPPPSLLPAQECWNTLEDAQRVSVCSKAGTVTCGRAGAVGPVLRSSLQPLILPHSHCAGGNSAGKCVGALWRG